jgi:hypothetical protein
MNAAATDALADVALTSAEFVAVASSRKLQIKARRVLTSSTLGANKNLSVEFTVAGLSKNQAAVVEHSVAANAATLTGNFEGYVQTSIDSDTVLSSSVSGLSVSNTIAVATADFVAPTTQAPTTPVVVDSEADTATETTTAAPEEEEEEEKDEGMSSEMTLIVAVVVVAVIMGAAGVALGWVCKGAMSAGKKAKTVDIADEEEKVDLAEAGEGAKKEVKA